MLVYSLCIIKAEEPASEKRVVSAMSILIPDDMRIQTELMGKPMFLAGAGLYKLPMSGDTTKVQAVQDIEVDMVDEPTDYSTKYVLGNAIISNSGISYAKLRAQAPHYWKVREIDEQDRRNALYVPKKHGPSDATKVQMVKSTLYDKNFTFDLADAKIKKGERYCIRYKMYNDFNKKKIEFFSELFEINAKDGYLEVVSESTNYFTSWWAITLYVVAGLLFIGLIAMACTKSKV